MRKDRPRGSTLATALLALSVAALLAAEESPSANRPVPEGWVTGTTLTDRDLDFAIDAPDGSWRWSLLPDSDPKEPPGSMLRCEREGYPYWFHVFVYSKCGGEVSDRFLEGLHRLVAKDAARSGWTLSRFDSTASSTPLPGSRHVSWTLSSANRTAHVRGYIIGSRRIYLLECDCGEDRDPEQFTKFASSFRVLAPPTTPGGGDNPLRRYWGLHGAGMAVVVVWLLGRHRPIAYLCILWFLIVIVLGVIQTWAAITQPRSDPSYSRQLGAAKMQALMQCTVAVGGIAFAVSQLVAHRNGSLAASPRRAAEGTEAPTVRRLDVDGASAVINPTWEAVRIALSQIGRTEPSHVTLSNAAGEQVQAAGIPSRLFIVCRRPMGGEWTYWSLGRGETVTHAALPQAPMTLQDAVVVFQEFYEHDRIPSGYELRTVPDESAG